MPDRLRRVIAWWQIICGLLGIAMFAAAYLDWLPGGRAYIVGTSGWINYYAGIGFFSFTVAAGRSLLRGEQWGLWASAICQAVQVVALAVLQGPHVHIAAGPLLGVRVSPQVVQFSAGFNASFFLGTRVAGASFEVTVNLIAAAWTSILTRAAVRARPKSSLAAA